MIDLKSKQYKVVKVNRKTRAKMFQNVEVGDVLEFSTELEHRGGGRGTYASYFTAFNITKKENTYKSQSELANLLANFDVEEIIFEESLTEYNIEVGDVIEDSEEFPSYTYEALNKIKY